MGTSLDELDRARLLRSFRPGGLVRGDRLDPSGDLDEQAYSVAAAVTALVAAGPT